MFSITFMKYSGDDKLMRVSIWQQFSSNHSGGFDLVGQFKTADDAETAYNIIREILNIIDDYYEEHLELQDQIGDYGFIPATPPERELAQKYGLTNWLNSVDWIPGGYSGRYHNLVFLTSSEDTWLDASPFDELLQKLGAKIEQTLIDDIHFENQTIPTISVTCRAPDEKKAAEICETLRADETRWGGRKYAVIKLPENRLLYDGAISYSGTYIQCSDMTTSTPSFGQRHTIHATEFLPELVKYLESQECKEFEFSVSHKPMGNTPVSSA